MIFRRKKAVASSTARLGGASDVDSDNVLYLPQRPRRVPDEAVAPHRKPSASMDASPPPRRVAPHEVDGFVPFPLCENGKWRTEYYRGMATSGAAARPHKVSFTSRDDELQIYDADDQAVVLAALKVAAEQWGTVSVLDGNAEFRSLCARLAVLHGIEMSGSPEFDALKEGRERMKNEHAEMPAPGM
jgi:hypothetical protein